MRKSKVIKVCGITQSDQLRQLEGLPIDYVGHIFFEKSPRVINDIEALKIKTSVNRVGVFVNESLVQIDKVAKELSISTIQLHGDESAELCVQLKELGFTIWKAIGIQEKKDVHKVDMYKSYVDAFLFDTKSSAYGGTGITFDWTILDAYTGQTPFLLSGGIGPNEMEILKKYDHPQWLGIDINSRFEIAAGYKNIEMIKNCVTSWRSE